MHLFLDYTSKDQVLYDYVGEEFLSTKDAYDFATETAYALKNQLNEDWTGWSIEGRDAKGKKYFTLSLDAAESSPLVNATDRGRETAGKPKYPWDQEDESPCRLLIVEDAAVHSAIIDRTAAKIGFTTTKAHSYEAAVAALAAQQFDCITLDLSLGDHIGLDVLRHLSSIQCGAQIIVVSQSDKDTCNDVVELGKALDLNVRDALQKPINTEALRNTLVAIRRQSCSQKPAPLQRDSRAGGA